MDNKNNKNNSFLEWKPQYEAEERNWDIKDYKGMRAQLKQFEEAERHKYSKMVFFKSGAAAVSWYYEKKTIGSPDMSMKHFDQNYVNVDNKSVKYDKESFFLVFCAVEKAVEMLGNKHPDLHKAVRLHHEENLGFKKIGEEMEVSTATASWLCGKGEFYIEGILDVKGLIIHYADFSYEYAT